MAQDDNKPAGPDLAAGIASSDLAEGAMLAGHVGEEEVLLARQGGRLFAVSAHCTHYHGPLAEGLMVGKTVRCPWHHAHFSLETGEALAAPALSPLACWQVEERDGRIFVRGRKEQPSPAKSSAPRAAHRHRRWRGRRLCRSRDAAAARLCRQHRHAEQRRHGAGRPPQPVEGLSRRQRAGGLGAAAR